MSAATTSPQRTEHGTMLRLELRRIRRDPVTLFFTIVLPGFLFLIFGTSSSYSDVVVGNGNVGMSIMIAMAAYGAVTATVGIGGMAAVERAQGWGRQLGLTPMRDSSFVRVKVALASMLALGPIALVYLLGAITGAEGSASAWILSIAVLVVGSLVFALYGLCFGLLFRSEAAISGASGSIVIFGFLGNVFFPLSGALLTFAKFTPLYGYASLARYPLTEGTLVSQDGSTTFEPLWIPVTNVLVWTVVMAIAATLLVRRGRGRQ